MLKTSKIINKLIFLTPLEDNFARLYLCLFPQKTRLNILCNFMHLDLWNVWYLDWKKRKKML